MTAERSAFDSLFSACAPAVLAYAIRRAPTRDDAEDAVAETFVVAWRRLADIPGGGEALLWLYAVCRRILANQRRGTKRRWHLLDRLRREPPRTVDARTDEPGPAIAALSRLRQDDQELLRLVAWEALTHAEIGTALGITPNAVAIRLYRARRRFEAEFLGMSEAHDMKASDRRRTSSVSEGSISGPAGREQST